MFYVALADGFEEIEALAFVDIIRRANIECKLVSVNNSDKAEGAHGIKVYTDVNSDEIDINLTDAFILPGGMPGTTNLDKSEFVSKMLDYCIKNDKYIGAICAAPSVLGHKGILNEKMATCYPGFEKELYNAQVVDKKVCIDGKIITAKGAGCAHDFAFEFVKIFKGEKEADVIRKSMQY